MNILFVAHERNLGGASKSLVTLAYELQKQGNKVVVVVPFKSGQVYEKLRELQIPVYKVFFGWWMMPSYWTFILKLAFRILYATEKIPAMKIAKIAKIENIQIIHSNSSVIDIGCIAANIINIPHVWHFREFGDADYQLEYLFGRKKSCKFVVKNGGRVIFISKNLREYYRKEIPDNLCQVIYNGVSEEFLRPKDYKRKYHKIIFLISGNLHRNKGQDIALRASKILRDKGYDNFELWIAGRASAMSDSKKYEEELHEYAKEYLQGNYKFLGFVSDMSEVRKQADIEMVCSNREAFGRVTVEAMFAGNPVLAADSGANTELVQDKKNGRIYKNKDLVDLAEKMQWFIDEPTNIAICGRNAYLYAKENFLSCLNTQNVMEVYENLLGIKSKENES